MATALIAAVVILAATPAMASKELAARSGCMGCHTLDKRLVGPAFREVAKKYTPADQAKLVDKVTNGGPLVWGSIPMPPNAAVKPDDIKRLVKWILAGAPDPAPPAP